MATVGARSRRTFLKFYGYYPDTMCTGGFAFLTRFFYILRSFSPLTNIAEIWAFRLHNSAERNIQSETANRDPRKQF